MWVCGCVCVRVYLLASRKQETLQSQAAEKKRKTERKKGNSDIGKR